MNLLKIRRTQNTKMSLPTQTPWEMLQEFFIEFDGKTNDYAEVDLETIKLCKNADGSITVYDSGLEDLINMVVHVFEY